jgi:16S rRNA (guanine527-N7)-methyltransferase
MSAAPMTAGDFVRHTGCQPSARARLQAYLDLLARWQKRINLVGASTLHDPWRRHVLDSAQIAPHLPPGRPTLVDLGSGAGFPGLVLAILTDADVVLVEADARKCAFLSEAGRVAEARVKILNQRMEALAAGSADVVTARACAPLIRLLAVAHPVLRAGGTALFLKGRTAGAELTQARKRWKMSATLIPSVSDASGAIVNVQDFEPQDDR